MVIVTPNQYILASKIHHIVMDEQLQHIEVRSPSGRYSTVMDRYYQITVIYTPENSTSNSSYNGNAGHSGNEMRECSVIIRGALNSHLVFKNLIQQIREQMPDEVYLRDALEKMIAGVNVEELEDRDARKDKAVATVGSKRAKSGSKAVRPVRKAKRTSKKVLRRAK